jgi:hypothetical protein
MRKSWLNLLGLTLAVLCVSGLVAAPEGAKAPADVPSDAEMVAVINIRGMLDSPLIKKYGLEELKQALKQNSQVQALLTTAGIDPFKDLDSITVAASSPSPDNPKVFIVAKGNFDPAKIATAVEGINKQKPDSVKVSKEDGVQLFEIKTDNKPVFAAFSGKNLIATLDKDYTLQSAKGAAKTGGMSKALQGAVSNLTGKETLWMAMVITEEMKKGMAANPQMAAIAPKLQNVTGSMDITNAINFVLSVQTTEAKAAKQLQMQINQVKPLLAVFAQGNEEAGPIIGELLENLKITADNTNLKISLKITEETLEKASKKK